MTGLIQGLKLLPNKGTAGTAVVLKGAGVDAATSVNFGSQEVAPEVKSPTEVVAEAPTGSGTVPVTVSTPEGSTHETPSDQFTYTPVARGGRGHQSAPAAARLRLRCGHDVRSGALGPCGPVDGAQARRDGARRRHSWRSTSGPARRCVALWVGSQVVGSTTLSMRAVFVVVIVLAVLVFAMAIALAWLNGGLRPLTGHRRRANRA